MPWLVMVISHHSHHSGDPGDHIGAGLVGGGCPRDHLFWEEGLPNSTWTPPMVSVPPEVRKLSLMESAWFSGEILPTGSQNPSPCDWSMRTWCSLHVCLQICGFSQSWGALFKNGISWPTRGAPTPTSAAHYMPRSMSSPSPPQHCKGQL